MREKSQEIGRRQLMNFMRLAKKIPTTKVRISEIGNAYETSERTLAAGKSPKELKIYYDGVLGLKFPKGEVTCYIESKAGRQSDSKLTSYLKDFLLNAYYTLEAWTSSKETNRPEFLFVTEIPFRGLIQERDGRLKKEAARSVLLEKINPVNDISVDYLVNNLHVVTFSSWIQRIMD